jgi:hypothetical protein
MGRGASLMRNDEHLALLAGFCFCFCFGRDRARVGRMLRCDRGVVARTLVPPPNPSA